MQQRDVFNYVLQMLNDDHMPLSLSLTVCLFVCVAAEEGLRLFVGPGGSTALGSQHMRWV